MVESPDGNYLVVTNNGYAKPTLTVVDLRRGYVSSKTNLDHAWLGLAWHPDGRRVFSSGAGQTTVNEFYWTPGKLTAGAGVRARPRHAEADAGHQPARAGRAELRRRHRDLARTAATSTRCTCSARR